MIEADPAIAAATIWQRLADDHGTTVAYPTLRTYVTSRRAARQVPASELTRAGRWPCRQEALPSAACTP